jgi:maltose alpha-D-glucosyltransferase / alpha-amylase
MRRNTLWFKDAIFYELHVKSFYDGNGDGVGDFIGLTQKLDYLQDLGIDCIWLLPFYASPLRDDGYDISDFYSIQPRYGTLADFQRLLDAAHQRNLHIIADLVVNHTSDQHPWFQSAQSSRQSPYRDYYVWSDSPHKYKQARIIFTDTERSNWTWDEQAGAYFWHRFFSHQPDLNYENPRVQQEMFKIVEYWLDMGLDGFRVDAVPYIYECEDTICENLPETHQFLKKLRRRIDEKYGDRLLLAEANQRADDVSAYFGKGDEFHMAFNFPLMPRLFMAVKQSDRQSVVDIIERLPPIPDNCQWGTFLRNHDELTLEMVSEEERDYMYAEFASEPRMKINLGIRRRLAPLLDNDRRCIELLNALLFSLPGSPIIYYGDEIGMGDNLELTDRYSVRTPMQWTGKLNAGFSTMKNAALYEPVITLPGYTPREVNVEDQQKTPSSLLNWMKHIIHVRKQYHAFGNGTIRFLQPLNMAVLAFIRSFKTEQILCIYNLASAEQAVTLDLDQFKGQKMIDMLTNTVYATLEQGDYRTILQPYEYLWLLGLTGK